MGNYSTAFTNVIPHNSLDIVTVFIGFHPCPLDKASAKRLGWLMHAVLGPDGLDASRCAAEGGAPHV